MRVSFNQVVGDAFAAQPESAIQGHVRTNNRCAAKEKLFNGPSAAEATKDAATVLAAAANR